MKTHFPGSGASPFRHCLGAFSSPRFRNGIFEIFVPFLLSPCLPGTPCGSTSPAAKSSLNFGTRPGSPGQACGGQTVPCRQYLRTRFSVQVFRCLPQCVFGRFYRCRCHVWSHFGDFGLPFWGSLETVKNITPLARKHTFWGLVPPHSRTFSVSVPNLGAGTVFLSVLALIWVRRVSRRTPAGHILPAKFRPKKASGNLAGFGVPAKVHRTSGLRGGRGEPHATHVPAGTVAD